MSRIQQLEEEVRRLKLAEHEKRRLAKLKKEEEWRKDNEMDVYTSDDYCGLRIGSYQFYFGYEVTKGGEWCFTADVDGKQVMKLKQSEVHPEEGEVPFWYLVAGIGHFLKQFPPNKSKQQNGGV